MAKKSKKTGPQRFFKKPLLIEGLRRFGALAILAYFLGFLAMGEVASMKFVKRELEKHIPISTVPFSVSGSTADHAKQLHTLTWHFLTHVPGVCSGEKQVANEYQRSQCSEFWDRLEVLGWVSSIPLVSSLLFFLMAWDSVLGAFARARKKLNRGKFTALAVVTDPAEAPANRVSWWFGVQPITVQMPEGYQTVVYLPPEAPVPLPGEKVAVYDWGRILGKKRSFAVLYAPHVAVLQGKV